ncbi:MAG: hypothetical protein M3O01_07360 [Pseudomonadota bacterium]|nr:hypothetical protein [Pseudomonadota bacterium]
MPHHHGEILGPVSYREGDGVAIEIPRGPCELDVTELDVTISWVEGASHGSTAIPLAEYARYVASGALKVE